MLTTCISESNLQSKKYVEIAGAQRDQFYEHNHARNKLRGNVDPKAKILELELSSTRFVVDIRPILYL